MTSVCESEYFINENSESNFNEISYRISTSEFVGEFDTGFLSAKYVILYIKVSGNLKFPL
jgi:hypothetical protein